MAKDGYRLSLDATGSFVTDRTHREDEYSVEAEAKFVTLGRNQMSEEWLFLSMVFDPSSECITFAGTHCYIDRYHTDKHPSDVRLNCGYRFGDANNNGTVNIVDAQLAYDMIPEKNPYTELSDYKKMRACADVNGVDGLRRGDLILDAVDAFAIQSATLRGWNQ